MGLQGLAEGLVVRCRADFRIEGLMAGNVIAVGAPGPGAQSVGMGAHLYVREPAFRAALRSFTM